MSADRSALPTPRFLRTTLSQLLVVFVTVPTLLFIVGAPGAVSYLCGAGCSLLPQLFFALRMERGAKRGARVAARLGMAAEAGKFLLSAAAFALVFAWVKPSSPAWVFTGFGVMWLVQVIEGARLLRRPQGPRG